ncbi:hypothetical protein [Sphingomonas sp.]|uniref:hypothetical protein n=1 Tax=Sphingomonas sp. TaxID=28214 RepID=UPI0025F4E5DC|nr:hypothetical protein [Sphingomonas sp.]MBV9529202.1 hypothetical protein [Sphingomonas sp.]
MKRWQPLVAIPCLSFLAACSLVSRAHREFQICAVPEAAFFNDISNTVNQLGYRASTGTAEDAQGHLTTVMKATRWTTAIWATNQVVFPALNQAGGEVIPRHDAFYISVDGLTSAQVNRAYGSLISKLSHDGYRVSYEPCP